MTYDSFSEQDTADKLILPYLTAEHHFPKASSLDFQAQHTLPLGEDGTGRYDGLYLAGGYPYAVLEAKRYSHALIEADFKQAREYATSSDFETPVPFIIVSNGQEHWFFKRQDAIDPADEKRSYLQIPACDWAQITEEPPGRIRRLLGEDELVH